MGELQESGLSNYSISKLRGGDAIGSDLDHRAMTLWKKVGGIHREFTIPKHDLNRSDLAFLHRGGTDQGEPEGPHQRRGVGNQVPRLYPGPSIVAVPSCHLD